MPTQDVLRQRFGEPPFTILNTRTGTWQERRQGWLSLGLQSDEGRAEDLLSGGTIATLNENYGKNMAGTSIFDPVLCELAYTWFANPGDIVIDPFAGGSVRGVVAAKLGLQYYGIDLRKEQIRANQTQWRKIRQNLPADTPPPQWFVGDSTNITTILEGIQADFLWTCPPYYDLEVYSSLPGELSAAQNYRKFLEMYGTIISQAATLLRQDRFAGIVVGNIRDKHGYVLDFAGDTTQLCQRAGLRLYNDAILVNCAGTLPIRAANLMRNRKLARAHQNILIYYKGNTKNIQRRHDMTPFDLQQHTLADWITGPQPTAPTTPTNTCEPQPEGIDWDTWEADEPTEEPPPPPKTPTPGAWKERTTYKAQRNHITKGGSR